MVTVQSRAWSKVTVDPVTVQAPLSEVPWSKLTFAPLLLVASRVPFWPTVAPEGGVKLMVWVPLAMVKVRVKIGRASCREGGSGLVVAVRLRARWEGTGGR